MKYILLAAILFISCNGDFARYTMDGAQLNHNELTMPVCINGYKATMHFKDGRVDIRLFSDDGKAIKCEEVVNVDRADSQADK